MAAVEERLQILVPRELKRRLAQAAKRQGLSVGELVRRAIVARLEQKESGGLASFPFGENPIRTGRRHGSVDHDRVR
jgi:predicted DNA-binding protein